MEDAAGIDRPRKRPAINIRQMEIDDIAQVFHLGEELFTASEWPNLYRTWDEYEVISLFQSDPELCLVAEGEEGLLGFALGTTIEKSHSAWKYGYLVWLGVRPSQQRSGVAARLFKTLKDLLMETGARILLVDTEADNLPALKFFRKQGFGNPQEHIFLTLNLDQARRKNGERKAPGRPPERFRLDDAEPDPD